MYKARDSQLRKETALNQNHVNSWSISSFGVPDGVRSIQDSRARVSVALLLKVVMLPGAGATSVLEVCIKNCVPASNQIFLPKRIQTARHAIS